MINTKLIFVDGISGSGKSTTAHYLARQLDKNGIKVKWFYEQEKDHPLQSMEKREDESDQQYTTRFLKDYPDLWEKFINSIKDEEGVYIIESFLFQDIIFDPLYNDFDREVIKQFIHKLCSLAATVNPVVVHYYQADVDQAVRANWLRRGDEWKNWWIGRDEKSPFCKNGNVSGEIGVITLWTELSNIGREVFSKLTFVKIEFENSAHDWENYRQQVLNLLEIEKIEEAVFDESYAKYCGDYNGTVIHIKDGRLCFDEFWPNLKLLYLGDDEFELEGFPINIKFILDENNEYSSLKFSRALCYFTEGELRRKIFPIELTSEEQEQFCGNYWAETLKLDRKIYIKDGSLYYWREESSESKLIPIDKNKLVMTRTTAVLTFDFAATDKSIYFHTDDEDDFTLVAYEAPDKCPFCAGKAKNTELEGNYPYQTKCYKGCGVVKTDKPDYFTNLSELQLKQLAAHNVNLDYNKIQNTINQEYLDSLLQEFELVGKAIAGYALSNPEIEYAGGCDGCDPLYIIKSDGKKYSLRLYDSRRDPSAIKAEIFWQKKLIENEIPVGEIIKDSNEDELHLEESSGRFCVVRNWIYGELLFNVETKKRPENLTEQIGELLAKMHKISEEIQLPADVLTEKRDYNYYQKLFNEYQKNEFASEEERNKFILVSEQFLQSLTDQRQDSVSHGLVHGDITYRNLIYSNEKLIPIDFMSVRHDHYLVDIAQLFHCDLKEQDYEKFWTGYKKIKTVPEAWEQIFPTFLQARAVGLAKVRTFLD